MRNTRIVQLPNVVTAVTLGTVANVGMEIVHQIGQIHMAIMGVVMAIPPLQRQVVR